MIIRNTSTGMIASVLERIISQVSREDADSWSTDDRDEKCLVLLTIPKGFTEAAKTTFEEVCDSCEIFSECEEREHLMEDFLSRILMEGTKTLLIEKMIEGGLKHHEDLQKMQDKN